MGAIIPTINQDILAARVGTTRSRIKFFMNKFRKLGFIEYIAYDGGLSGLKVHTSLLNVVVHDRTSMSAVRGGEEGRDSNRNVKFRLAKASVV